MLVQKKMLQTDRQTDRYNLLHCINHCSNEKETRIIQTNLLSLAGSFLLRFFRCIEFWSKRQTGVVQTPRNPRCTCFTSPTSLKICFHQDIQPKANRDNTKKRNHKVLEQRDDRGKRSTRRSVQSSAEQYAESHQYAINLPHTCCETHHRRAASKNNKHEGFLSHLVGICFFVRSYSLRLLPVEFCFVQRRNKVVNLCAFDLRSEIRNLIPEERHSFREVTEKKKPREYNQSCYSSSLACFPLASGRTPLHKVRESRFFSLGHFSAVHHHHHPFAFCAIFSSSSSSSQRDCLCCKGKEACYDQKGSRKVKRFVHTFAVNCTIFYFLVLAFLGFNGEMTWNFCCSSQRMAALGVTNFFKLPVSVPYAMLASVLCSSFDPNPWHR